MGSKAFSDDEFSLFLKSPLREKMKEEFKNDFIVMKIFFNELVKKVEGHLNSYEGPFPESLERVKEICNQTLCPKKLFSQIFA